MLRRYLAILAGAHGMVEVNTRLRSDLGLQRAFGRRACAEQSVIQDTLDANSAENVQQLQQTLDQIYRQHSQGYQHAYEQDWQVLDADMSGMPCGKKAVFASRGYFARVRNRRGRQLGRVVASRYDEVVVDRLFPGTIQLVSALPTLLLAAERTLALDVAKRAQTIVRVDAGGGSLDDINWLLREQPKLRRYGIKRMVRDVSQISGMLVVDGLGHLVQIILKSGRAVGARVSGGAGAAARTRTHCRYFGRNLGN